jgi:hypothetical protein
VIPRNKRATSPGRKKITMHTIEYDGAEPAPWKITADDGTEWHAANEIEAAVELAGFIISREQDMPALPEVAVLI